MSKDAIPAKVGAEQAIEYLQEHPAGGLFCEAGRWWIAANANDAECQALVLDAAEAEQLKDHPLLRPATGTAHAGRMLWVVRRMT